MPHCAVLPRHGMQCSHRLNGVSTPMEELASCGGVETRCLATIPNRQYALRLIRHNDDKIELLSVSQYE